MKGLRMEQWKNEIIKNESKKGQTMKEWNSKE